jgi:hypothetical protein
VDTNRFDHVVRSLQAGAPRRQVLGVLLGGALGVAGLAESEAKRKRKISICLNGQTKSINKKKKASFLSQGATVGACPKSPPAPTCPTTQKLCNGRCIDQAKCCTDADCDKCKQLTCQNETCACKPGTIADVNGFCGIPPANGASCGSPGQIVANQGLCCSSTSAPQVGGVLCLPGTTTCRSAADCGNNPCKGFMCPAVYTATVGEACPVA